MDLQPPSSDWLHVAASGGAATTVPPGATNEWTVSDRPQKKLRTVRSHASALRPLVRLVKDPFGSIGVLAESLGIREKLDSREQACRLQRLRLEGAKTRREWDEAAKELDRLEDNEAWKNEDESSEYDYQLIKSRLRRLEDAYARADFEEMRFLIRTSLTRDLGGMGDSRLYRHTHMGTKTLIERYNEAVLEVLELLVDSSGHGPYAKIDARQMQDQMKQTRQAFGRSALLLSGGGTFGMNHIGVAKCLFEAELLPRIISGASAGSIVAAVICAKTDDEIPDVLVDFCHGPLDVFEASDMPASTMGRAVRLMKTGAVYDVSNLKRVMRDILGDLTFLEAYNRTQRILNICVSTSGVYDQPRLLNYITAPDVMIWSAVAASCSVPGVFTSAQLLVRDGDSGEQRPWDDTASRCIDGSVDNDLPMTRLAEMLNVNHFIVSQVNPHVVPFLPKHEDEMRSGHGSHAWPGFASGPSWMQTTASLAKGEALHRLHVMAELGLWPGMMTKLRSILGQRYSGDITILPEVSFTQFPLILSNPTPDFMLQAMYNGERATWPKLSRIRNHLAVELALDKAVHKLIARVVFSPSQVDVRLGLFQNRRQLNHGRRGESRGSQHSAHSVMFVRDGNQGAQGQSAPQSWYDRSPTKNDFGGEGPEPEHVKTGELLLASSQASSTWTLGSEEDHAEYHAGHGQRSFAVPRRNARSFISQPGTPLVNLHYTPHKRPDLRHQRTYQGDLFPRADRTEDDANDPSEYFGLSLKSSRKLRPVSARISVMGQDTPASTARVDFVRRKSLESPVVGGQMVKPLQPIMTSGHASNKGRSRLVGNSISFQNAESGGLES